MPRKTHRPISQLISNDPAFAAEDAAIRFESEEQDRYDRVHSFVCRHINLCFYIGMVMVFAPVVAMVTLGGSYDFTTPSGISLLTKLTGTSGAGVLLVLITFARPGSRNLATAWRNILLVLGMFLAIPLIWVFMAITNSLSR